MRRFLSRFDWPSLGIRIVVVLAVLAVIPACDKSDTNYVTGGPAGPPGPSGENPPAQWSDPANISRQIEMNKDDAEGQQAVFTPDGRLHVVYFADDDADTGVWQLFYTSAAAPYAEWDDPVRVTSDNDYYSPWFFDLAASSDNSAHIVFGRDGKNSVGVSSVAAGTGVYTLDAAVPSNLVDNTSVTFSGMTNAANNGTFTVTSVGTNTVTVINAASVAETSSNGVMTFQVSKLFYTHNTAAARPTFSETQIFEAQQTWNGYLQSARILMRGTTAHVVLTDEYLDMKKFWHYGYQYLNSASNWTADPISLGDSDSWVGFDHYAFTSDPAGTFHLVYMMDDVGSGDEYILYRPLPLAANSLGQVQQVNSGDSEDIWFEHGPPIVQFDGDNNVYVFWKQWHQPEDIGAIYCNIKGAHVATFNQAAAARATVEPQDDHFMGEIAETCDMQVTPEGRIHIIWRTTESYGDESLYPLWHRAKDFDLSPSAGWHDAQVAAWVGSTGPWAYNGGLAERARFVRPASDGTVHVFYVQYVSFDGGATNLHHAYLPAGSDIWHDGGIVTRATDLATTPYGYAYSYFLDAGVEDDGTPYVLWTSEPNDMDGGGNGNILYSHRQGGVWPEASDLNGPGNADVYGWFWVGQDLEGKLHAIWQQEVDPFNYNDYYDLMHACSPVVVQSAWRFPQQKWVD